jgi:DNA gyrase subunit B
VRYLDRTKQAVLSEPIMIHGEKDGITVDCALWWNDSYHENVLCFTNNIPQRDGGTHLAGFRGALTQGIMANEAAATEAAAYVARRLDAISEEMERGWSGSVENGGFVFRRTLRGVTEAAVLDPGLLNSAEARKLDERTASLQEFYTQPARLLRRSDDVQVNGPLGLFDAIMTIARKGLTMQRYKGLGEMTAQQLWETTLDRNVRSLLQVKLRDVAEAEDIFVRLMGDVVEPRRAFIQENALSVSNLDV